MKIKGMKIKVLPFNMRDRPCTVQISPLEVQNWEECYLWSFTKPPPPLQIMGDRKRPLMAGNLYSLYSKKRRWWQ